MRTVTLDSFNPDKQGGSYYDYWEQRTFSPADRKEEIVSTMVTAFFNFPEEQSIYESKLTNEGLFYDFINGDGHFQGQLTRIMAKVAKGDFEAARAELKGMVDFVFDLIADTYLDSEAPDDLDYSEDF